MTVTFPPRPPVDDAEGVGSGPVNREDSRYRVGVLSLHNSTETKAILNAVEALGHDPVWIREENLRSWIADGDLRLEPRVDVVVNRLLLTKSTDPLEDLRLATLYEETAPAVNPACQVGETLHKHRTAATLARAGLRVPDAYFGRSPRQVETWPEHLPADAVRKPTIGTNARNMSVVSPGEPVGPVAGGEQSFLQEFLSDGGRPSDVRVYVVGGAVVGAMRRHAPEGEWRTNVARGGEIEDVTGELGAKPRRIARTAATATGLDLAGVDLMSAGGGWHVLEVNATAGFRGLFSATGVSPAPHIARLAIERAGGSVDDSRVADLESTLDDSVPACKPPLSEAGGDGSVLGYTTRVRVAGRNGVEAAVAKSDTGAERTSVDTDLAGHIGAGPVVGTTQVRSGVGSEARPLVEIDLRVNGGWRSVTASITDRSGMSHAVLLGRDVLESYTLDVARTVEE